MKITKALSPIIVTGALAVLLLACTEQSAEKPATDSVAADRVAVVVDKAPAENPVMTQGKRVFSSCAGCHTINTDGGSSIGPNLWGVVGSAAGSKSDFAYSDALKESGVIWTLESLDSYIENPASFMPGGNMVFVGVTDDADRKALLAYLVAILSDDSTNLSAPTDQGEDSAIWE
jgi:cytochrome c